MRSFLEGAIAGCEMDRRSLFVGMDRRSLFVGMDRRSLLGLFFRGAIAVCGDWIGDRWLICFEGRSLFMVWIGDR
ncbi:hypothetical protein [Pseudanabaena mucicola]|uniref:hypothetical protein n=1 Tax=Pseudanabaena mucicola TaxID=71190 RepID=UPI002575271F|nr:hypothetical protein [Pseudanabaena mucicola]